jgi:hypothetical protein
VGGVRRTYTILTMHRPINVKSPNNTSKWQMGFNSAFKELRIFLESGGSRFFLNLVPCTLLRGVTSCTTEILEYKPADVREIDVFKYVPCI